MRAALALAHDGAQEERRRGRDDDVELRAERAVVDRLLREEPEVVGGDPDREQRENRDRERRPRGAEPEGGPDQRREHDVGQRLARRDGERRQGDDRTEQQPAFERADASHRGARVARPGQRERQNDDRPGGVPEPPGAPEGAHLIRADHPAEPHRERADGRAQRGRRPEREQHPGNLVRPVERRAPADQALQEQRADDDLRHVPELLADDAPDGKRRVLEQKLRVDEQLPDEDARPPAQPQQIQSRDPETDRRPHRCHRARVAQRLADLGRAVVGRGERDHPGRVARKPRQPRRLIERRLESCSWSLGAQSSSWGDNWEYDVTPETGLRQIPQRRCDK